MNIRHLCAAALMAALLCVLAPLAIPLTSGVPVSLATLGVMLAGALCFERISAAAVCTYILLGILGLPVFAGYTSGAAIVFGMSGGYIFGYIPLALCTAYAVRKIPSGASAFQKYAILSGGMLTGTAVLYIIGTVWFMRFTGMGLSASLAACVLPFIPGDLLKMGLVILLYPRLKPAADHLLQN